MLILNKESLKNVEAWRKTDVDTLHFDYDAMVAASKESPKWVHFGIGNIFRAFVASVQLSLLNQGESDSGIVAVETHDLEVLEKVYKPHDNLSLLVIMNSDGTLQKSIIGSISESLYGDPSCAADWKRLMAIFINPSLQMVSFTITEKGYSIKGLGGDYLPEVQEDLKQGPTAPKSVMAKVAALAYLRFKAGAHPLALVSMDNWARNGEKLQQAVSCIAAGWVENKLVEAAFLDYINDPKQVAFPWTMIDKITPRPSASVQEMLKEVGLGGNDVIRTAKDTHIAPFVNAEKPQYLVVEDQFPNGRPPLEKAGVIFTDRETVEKVDKMKVCTCLNPLMTSLAIFGCLLEYTLIADEMKNPQLNRLVREVGYTEGMPVVVDPKVLNPQDFIDEAIEERLPNPFIPDTPQRIATDTSQKVVRFGETIKAYMASPDLDARQLTYIPLVIAGWCRYLMGLNDRSQPMPMSTDPLLDKLQACVAPVRMGDLGSVGDCLRPILSNTALFGVDLYAAGLGEKIEGFFKEMIAGPGAVQSTLEKYLGDK